MIRTNHRITYNRLPVIFFKRYQKLIGGGDDDCLKVLLIKTGNRETGNITSFYIKSMVAYFPFPLNFLCRLMQDIQKKIVLSSECLVHFYSDILFRKF
jgi:hypothetical protein